MLSARPTLSLLCLAAIISSLSFSSCGRALMLYYGVKKMKPRSETTLMHFLAKQGMDTTEVYAMGAEEWIKGMPMVGRSVEVFIFDSLGRMVPYGPDGEWVCTSDAAHILTQLSDTLSYTPSSRTDLKTELNRLYTMQGEKMEWPDEPEAAFTVIIYWSYWGGGRLLRQSGPTWERYLADNDQTRIRKLSVSLDPQPWWDERVLQKLDSTNRIKLKLE